MVQNFFLCLCLNLIDSPVVVIVLLFPGNLQWPLNPRRLCVFQAAEQQSTEEDVSIPSRSQHSSSSTPAFLS